MLLLLLLVCWHVGTIGQGCVRIVDNVVELIRLVSLLLLLHYHCAVPIVLANV